MTKRFFSINTTANSLLVVMVCLVQPSHQASANEVSVHKNEQSGLLTWTSEGNGFSLELIQLLPDFVRAVYSKHGFPDSEVERIAGYCIFGSIIKNTSQQLLSYRVADWYYREQNGTTHPLKTKSQWLEEWRKAGVKFSWTLLPDSGEFEIGDWQQGFTTIKLPRNTELDLIYNWQLDGVKHEATINNLRCAPASLSQKQD